MKPRKFSLPFPPDSKINWLIRGWVNDGHSSQDDDGFHYINIELKVETKEEAIRLFEAKVKELKQAVWGDGENKYVRINISLEMEKENSTKTVKKASWALEKYIREEIRTLKTGRGWIESKKWLHLTGSEKLKDGSTRTKTVYSSDSDWY